MAKRASSFVDVTMWHGGRFSTATKGNKDVIDGATRLVLDANRRPGHRHPDSLYLDRHGLR